MFETKVRNFRGAIHVDLSLDPIALVAGLNEAGKSSVCQAVAAALSRTPLPFLRPGRLDSAVITKSDAPSIVTDGAERGGVLLRTDAGTVQIGWPKLGVDTDGEPPLASKVAAGLATPLELEAQECAKFWAVVLKTKPTQDQFIKAVTESGLNYEANHDGYNKVWDEVEVQGFDAVYKSYKDKATSLKGAWEQATGERYGEKKAENYVPAGWHDDLKDETQEGIDERHAKAKQEVETAIATAAVSDSELDNLSRDAAHLEDIEKQLAKAQREAAQQETVVNGLRQAVEAAEHGGQPFVCDHCGGVNLVEWLPDGPHVSATEKSEADLAEQTNEITKAKAKLHSGETALTGIRSRVSAHNAECLRYAQAGEKLKAAQERKGDPDKLNVARDILSSTEREKKAFETKKLADQLAGRIHILVTLVELLSPAGLRSDVLGTKLTEFNSFLAGLCGVAGYQRVVLTEELQATWEGRPYFLLAESARWKCRAIIQIAVALRDGSPAVVIDGADIMDQAGKNGLLKLLIELVKKHPLKALVAMTVSKRETVPDLAKAKVGNTYWLEKGKVAV
jgi:hypothetical protein